MFCSQVHPVNLLPVYLLLLLLVLMLLRSAVMTSPSPPPPTYRQAAAAATSASSTRGASAPTQAERRSFLQVSSEEGLGVDEVETPATLTLTLVQQILAWVFRQKHPLLILLHMAIAIVTVIAVAVLAAGAPPSQCLCRCPRMPVMPPDAVAGNWTGGSGGDNDSTTTTTFGLPWGEGSNDNDTSTPVWRLTKKELSRTVRKAVRNTFLRPENNEMSIFQILVQDLTAHLETRSSESADFQGVASNGRDRPTTARP